MDKRIRFEDVSLNYLVIRERVDSLREAAVRLFQKKSEVLEFQALKRLSFSVGEGEVLGIIGRNGSGKSSLLKLIAGVLNPSAGRLSIIGSVAPLIELGAGFHHDLTGRENIYLNGLLLGLSRAKIARLEQQIIEFSELGDFIDSPVKQYSSGMFMRLAFSIAIETDPDILLVDEILSVGDFEFQKKCDERIEQFRRDAKTIVLVSHDLSVVRKVCNRALLLEHGAIMANGPVPDVIQQYEGRVTVSVPG